MEYIKHGDFSDGETRQFQVTDAPGGTVMSHTPYEYEGRMHDQWTMHVRQLPNGNPSELALSKTMKSAVAPLVASGKIGNGDCFKLTRHSRSSWSAEKLGADAAAGSPQIPRTSVQGAEATNQGARWPKYSSPVLSREQMDGMQEYAAAAADLTASALGIEADEAKASVFATLLIMAQNCGIPTEFGEALRDRDALRQELLAIITEAGLDRAEVGKFMAETADVADPRQVSEEDLRRWADNGEQFVNDFLAWQEPPEPERPITDDDIPF